VYQVGINKGIILRCTAYQISRSVEESFVFFWVIPRLLDFICRRFGTLCSIFIGWLVPTRLWRWNRQSVPKRRYIKFRHRVITQKKA